MGRGRFKAKPTGRRNFSTPEEMDVVVTQDLWVTLLAPQLVLAPSKRPIYTVSSVSQHAGLDRSHSPFYVQQKEAEYSEEEEPGEESGGDSEQETEKKKGILHISEIQNPNLVKPKNMKARAADVESTPELSRRERAPSINTTTKIRGCKEA
ncbi:hypothetical protein C4D60_Mb03t16800 [Musa balbisiana]|uniref:Uncharacterized protein n=1 Tax=Musa balbisiana TaxID=52838 RepID=A0A4S8JAE7_MUSBA|nr:hypothetical protein C4D60_Mb03t16800 [Musa balbisiana]